MNSITFLKNITSIFKKLYEKITANILFNTVNNNIRTREKAKLFRKRCFVSNFDFLLAFDKIDNKID